MREKVLPATRMCMCRYPCSVVEAKNVLQWVRVLGANFYWK